MGWGSILGGAAGTFFGGPAGSAIGAGLGGMLEQSLANDYNSGQAAAQMDFQRNMRSTSYQAAMADMKAAGLNPMLAFSQGGAAVPTGAMASYASIEPSSAAVASLNQSLKVPSEIDVNTASAANTRQQTKTESFRTAVANNEAIKGNYAVMQLAAQLDAAMQVTGKVGSDALAALEVPRVKAGLAELRAALASANNDAQVYEALNSKAVQVALDVLGRLTGSGNAIAGAVDRYRARSQRGDIINLNKD